MVQRPAANRLVQANEAVRAGFHDGRPIAGLLVDHERATAYALELLDNARC